MTESTYLGDTPVDLDAFETQCPQPLYAEVARQTPFRTDDGMVYLTRMADVTSALKQREVRSGGEAMGSHRPLIPLNIDGPEHTKYRRLLDPLFAPKRVATFEPVVHALADELIDAFIDDGQVELFGAFCDPLPSRVFLGILGLPQSDVGFLQEFKEAAIRPRGTTPEAALAYQEEKTQGMYAYLNAELDRREALADSGDDVIGWFLQTEVEGDRLTRENILDIVYLLVIAGLDTVASSLSCLIAWLAQHPEEQERVVSDPALLPRVIEELMRFESPVPMASRTAVADIHVNGKEVKAGDMLVVIWSAANLDPDVFDHPLDVDFDREKIPHVHVRERLSPVSRFAPRTPRAPHRDRPVPRAHPEVPPGRRCNSRVSQPGSAERESARARFRPRVSRRLRHRPTKGTPCGSRTKSWSSPAQGTDSGASPRVSLRRRVPRSWPPTSSRSTSRRWSTRSRRREVQRCRRPRRCHQRGRHRHGGAGRRRRLRSSRRDVLQRRDTRDRVRADPVRGHAARELQQGARGEPRRGVPRCEKATRQFIKQGGGGTIVVTSSTSGLVAYPGFRSYVAAKSGVNGLVHRVGGGSRPTRHPDQRAVPVPRHVRQLHGQPRRRPAREVVRADGRRLGPVVRDHAAQTRSGAVDPRRTQNVALFLASDESAYMSGVCIPATDGGTYAKVAINFPE